MLRSLWHYACPVAYGLRLVPEKWMGLYMFRRQYWFSLEIELLGKRPFSRHDAGMRGQKYARSFCDCSSLSFHVQNGVVKTDSESLRISLDIIGEKTASIDGPNDWMLIHNSKKGNNREIE